MLLLVEISPHLPWDQATCHGQKIVPHDKTLPNLLLLIYWVLSTIASCRSVAISQFTLLLLEIIRIDYFHTSETTAPSALPFALAVIIHLVLQGYATKKRNGIALHKSRVTATCTFVTRDIKSSAYYCCPYSDI